MSSPPPHPITCGFIDLLRSQEKQTLHLADKEIKKNSTETAFPGQIYSPGSPDPLSPIILCPGGSRRLPDGSEQLPTGPCLGLPLAPGRPAAPARTPLSCPDPPTGQEPTRSLVPKLGRRFQARQSLDVEEMKAIKARYPI